VPLAERKGIELRVVVDPLVPSCLLGDALRIRQILTNLVSNAVKFTSSGGVRVSVIKRSGAKGDHCALRFEVRDTGKGIRAEARERLFTEFMQEDASTARNFGGTGLGLALCRQLVNLMDGETGVESEPGKGSVFWFELVLAVAGETVSS
jgi:signal transduction histidine kinase